MLTHPTVIVDRILVSGERIHFEDSPDLRVWVASQWFDIAVMIITAVIVQQTDNSIIGIAGSIATLVMATLFLWRMAEHWYTRYVITDHRAIRVSGVIRRDYEWMTWSKVTDVSVSRNPFDRLFGTATIKIQSANEASGFAAMSSLSHPVEFADWVARLVRHKQGAVRLPGDPGR